MNTNNKIIPTKHFQIKALQMFAKDLGYVPRNSELLGEGFKKSKNYRGVGHISFKDMCSIYNGNTQRYCLLDLFGLDEQLFTKALNNRIIKQVKLQRCKREKDKVKCFNDLVCLTKVGGREYSLPLCEK